MSQAASQMWLLSAGERLLKLGRPNSDWWRICVNVCDASQIRWDLRGVHGGSKGEEEELELQYGE